MDFTLSDQQLAIKESIKNFAETEILPHALTWDEESYFPVTTFKKAAELGLAAICVAEEMGGSGLTRLESAIIFEELATACPSTAAYLSIHNMVCSILDQHATREQKKRWLPPLITMDFFSSYCLTEPSAGSDAAALKTTAQKMPEGFYLVNGSKAFISGGSVSDIYLCMVRTGGEGADGISCLLIEKDTPGLSFGQKEAKMGWRNMPTTQIYLEDCKVPVENLIGQEGQGFKIALSALNGGRINIAACSLGGAKKCLLQTKEYLQTRHQFKTSLAEFEALQFKYADMLTDFEAAKLLVYKAADALENKQRNAIIYSAMAKRFATDKCFEICNQALQLHGGYGYIREYGIEKIFRDLRVHQILEGTNEIMRLIIARQAFNTSLENL